MDVVAALLNMYLIQIPHQEAVLRNSGSKPVVVLRIFVTKSGTANSGPNSHPRRQIKYQMCLMFFLCKGGTK